MRASLFLRWIVAHLEEATGRVSLATQWLEFRVDRAYPSHFLTSLSF